IVFIPILVFIFVLSDEIIILYASGKYNESITPLKYFSLVIFLNATTYLQREGVLYVFEREKYIIKFNLIAGLINIISNLILYFLGLFTPTTAIITLGISFFFLTVIMRINVKREVNEKIKLIDLHTIKYFGFSLAVVLINFFIGLFISNMLIKLGLVLIVFFIIYLILLMISKDKILLINYKIIKEKFINKKSKT
ncbi:MAG TPA: hypothetical protein GX740_04440, partial [Acholeplasmataceae bacterium]|nr:hypothetical protein [Acholeplasmataceae bacterium]